jgi:hypothetical protein
LPVQIATARQRLAAQQQLVRDTRSAAVRETSETEEARQLLATIRERAESMGADTAIQGETVRDVTKEIVVQYVADRRIRVRIVYVFQRRDPIYSETTFSESVAHHRFSRHF